MTLFSKKRKHYDIVESDEDESEEEADMDILCVILSLKESSHGSLLPHTIREKYGEFNFLKSIATEDDFFKYLRMTKNHFNYLHSLISSYIKSKIDCKKAISTEEKLAICLR